MLFDVHSMHSVQDGPDPYVKYSQPAVYVIAQGTRRLGCTHSACTSALATIVIQPSADLRPPSTPYILQAHDPNLHTADRQRLYA